MKWLPDAALGRLRTAADLPDLSATHYVLLDKLGEGGMGAVYRVEDKLLGRMVALKVIRVADSSGTLAERLLREAKIIAQLEHPGIVPVHDVGTLPDGRVFYTMKLVQGRRLDQWTVEPGGLPEILRSFQKICEAVSFAHAHNVLHRDLKPQNIMVGRFGEVLVMDWGLAKVLHGEAAPEMQGGARTERREGLAEPVTVGAETELRNSRSLPISEIPFSISCSVLAIVTSETGKASSPSRIQIPTAPRE